jgi:hypothetical protein
MPNVTLITRGNRRTGMHRRRQAIVARATRAARDRRVQRDARRTAVAASRAARRAHALGLSRALSDRRTARNLRRTRRHATRAARRVLRPPSHRKRNAALIAAGLGTLTSIAYGGVRKPR